MPRTQDIGGSRIHILSHMQCLAIGDYCIGFFPWRRQYTPAPGFKIAHCIRKLVPLCGRETSKEEVPDYGCSFFLFTIGQWFGNLRVHYCLHTACTSEDSLWQHVKEDGIPHDIRTVWQGEFVWYLDVISSFDDFRVFMSTWHVECCQNARSRIPFFVCLCKCSLGVNEIWNVEQIFLVVYPGTVVSSSSWPKMQGLCKS